MKFNQTLFRLPIHVKKNHDSKICLMSGLYRSRILIILLLISSGNIHPNPGPLTDNFVPNSSLSFTDFCARKGLGFLHINIWSLLPKIDQLKVWVAGSFPDMLIISETWLKKYVLDNEICLSG